MPTYKSHHLYTLKNVDVFYFWDKLDLPECFAGDYDACRGLWELKGISFLKIVFKWRDH